MFYHSLRSDWNHGNAHFLRGVATELGARGHSVSVYEPRDGWSMSHLVAEQGRQALAGFRRAYPGLRSRAYDPARLDLDRALRGAGLVLVHEWNDPALIAAVGDHHARTGSYRLLFHDTHHRSHSDSNAIAACDLSGYDGVLAYGGAIRERYLREGWAERAWTWHEAADTRVFRPRRWRGPKEDLVWIGNWGDGERASELHEYLIEPVRSLGLRARVHGVRYPAAARAALARAGLTYAGWLPNYEVPALFARFRTTVHVPRRPYVESLPGIPTIRVFEALACGIPLVSAPWPDVEGLFTPGRDFLVASDPGEMRSHLASVASDAELARRLRCHGLATIRRRHTCAHRVDELLDICTGIDGRRRGRTAAR
jgi:spore maturation protein CgeB